MTASQSNASRFIGISSIALVMALVITGCNHVKQAFEAPDTSPPVHLVRSSDEQQGALYEQKGIMTKQNYLRLAKIQEGIDRTQTVSEPDIDFLAHQLRLLPVRKASPNQIQAENIILAHTYGSPGHKPKRLTSSQRSRLYNAIVPYTNSPDQWVQVNASLALAATHDPRAIPVLEGMAQHSPYPVVRLDANVWLKNLRHAQ